MALFLQARFQKSLILFLCKINIFRSSAWEKLPHPREGGEEEAEPAQLLAPKGFCCRLCFPKQPSSSSDHLQGREKKNKNKTKIVKRLHLDGAKDG